MIANDDSLHIVEDPTPPHNSGIALLVDDDLILEAPVKFIFDHCLVVDGSLESTDPSVVIMRCGIAVVAMNVVDLCGVRHIHIPNGAG